MAAASDDVRSWSPARWIATIAVVFGIQAAFFLWLGSHEKHPTAAPVHPLNIQLPADPDATFPGVKNPTALIKPDDQNFSRAWLTIPEMTHEPAEWSGQSNARLDRPTKPLLPEITALASNRSIAGFSVVEVPRAEPQPIPLLPDADAMDSTITVGGDLATRPLVAPPELLPQYADAFLSNSVVHIDVDGEGNVFNPPVTLPGGFSGSTDTDDYARKVAKSLRFRPLPRATRADSPAIPRLTEGTVVFHWRTRVPPVTNGAPTPP